jgi:NAD(P)-dependent dehydrogenase (short-subunit alcohol dehydrogenase family)
VNYTAAVEHFGSVDFPYNNAAIIGPMRPLTETALHDFDEMMTANIRSVFSGLRAVIRQLLAQGKAARSSIRPRPAGPRHSGLVSG